MSENARQLETLIGRGYQHGFVTEIDSDTVAPGLDEDVVRLISRKKQEPAFLTEWRLKALRHWLTMREPHWAHVKFAPIDYQSISYYSAPKSRKFRFRSIVRRGNFCGLSCSRGWRRSRAATSRAGIMRDAMTRGSPTSSAPRGSSSR